MSTRPFQHVGGLRPQRTQFDLSHRKALTCSFGELIPVLLEECVPGDHFKIGNEVLIRFQPLMAPVMHEFSASVHYFFVPYRILYPNTYDVATGKTLFERFIQQGEAVDNNNSLPVMLPQVAVSGSGSFNLSRYSLWDYFGFPIPPSDITPVQNSFGNWRPLDIPWRAYNTIWNEYYRDEDLQNTVDIAGNNSVLLRNWRKDYFTSSRPFLQKGQAPGLPVNVTLTNNQTAPGYAPLSVFSGTSTTGTALSSLNFSTAPNLSIPASTSIGVYNQSAFQVPSTGLAGYGVATNAIAYAVSQGVTAGSTTFNISDLRLAFQIQKWLERNARAGTRYTEFLQAHFGVHPSDSRLQRPEYIGGSKQSVVVSEVLQTSQTTTSDDPLKPSPQGNMAGHGISADGQFCGSYNVKEYGCIIGLLSVMPKRSYQDGILRSWTRHLPTDFYFPEYAHLSEQAIKRSEIQCMFGNTLNGGTLTDGSVFGYQGRYDELRVRNDQVVADMRKYITSNGSINDLLFSYWNFADKYTFNVPQQLNSGFIQCVPRKDAFAVQSVKQLIVNVQNNVHAIRPLPPIGEPGLVDHF